MKRRLTDVSFLTFQSIFLFFLSFHTHGKLISQRQRFLLCSVSTCRPVFAINLQRRSVTRGREEESAKKTKYAKHERTSEKEIIREEEEEKEEEEEEGKGEGKKSWQIHGSWSVLLDTQEVSRCGGDALQ